MQGLGQDDQSALRYEPEPGFEIARVEASDGMVLDYYGSAVTANDTHFAVGAKLDDDKLLNSGSVYVHSLPTRVGVNYCTPAAPNSTGQPATIEALGSAAIIDDTLVLVARQVPKNRLGLFIVSASSGNVPGAGGGQGTLCLGGQIARSACATIPVKESNMMSSNLGGRE